MSGAPELTSEHVGVLARPQHQFAGLPVAIRWEVTRRHPYYLTFWREALAYREGDEGPEAQRLLRQAAVYMLGAIGVSGTPVCPTTSFEALISESPDPQFLCGAVQPISLRSMVALLINALPPAERAVVGALLTMSGNDEYQLVDDEHREMQKAQALLRLAQIPSAVLDSCPDSPLTYIHLAASQRTIVADTKEFVRRARERLNISETRIQQRKLQSYLDVWDLREGWRSGEYDRSLELTFVEIARQQRQPLSTVANKYRAAFQLIVGHPFSPNLWTRTMGCLKLSALQTFEPKEVFAILMRHRLRSPVDRDVAETVLRSDIDVDSTGLIEDISAIADGAADIDLMLDLEDLIRSGLSDVEISRRLEIGDSSVVSFLRARLEEFRECSLPS